MTVTKENGSSPQKTSNFDTYINMSVSKLKFVCIKRRCCLFEMHTEAVKKIIAPDIAVVPSQKGYVVYM